MQILSWENLQLNNLKCLLIPQEFPSYLIAQIVEFIQ